jgi:hypothetical protein
MALERDDTAAAVPASGGERGLWSRLANLVWFD